MSIEHVTPQQRIRIVLELLATALLRQQARRRQAFNTSDASRQPDASPGAAEHVLGEPARPSVNANSSHRQGVAHRD